QQQQQLQPNTNTSSNTGRSASNSSAASSTNSASSTSHRKNSISGLFAKIGINSNSNTANSLQQPPALLPVADSSAPTSASDGRQSPVLVLNEAQVLAVNRELNDKHYLNSARILHNYGVTGIAPLAPLSQKKDDKSVIPVMVSWSGGGRTVHITGTFNNWKQKIRLTKSKTDFSTVIDMPAGETHRFKFIVDDEWKCSEDLPIASDAEGNEVNYLDVVDEFGDEIHDGFDGLAHDGKQSELTRATRKAKLSRVGNEINKHGSFFSTDNLNSALGESPESSYTSKIPSYLSWHLENQQLQQQQQQQQQQESTAMDIDGDNNNNNTPQSPPMQRRGTPPPLPTDPPPHLPPHLEKVFLNLPIPVTSHRDDNLILPVPNGVTLNHLYACSIRDGVMALSTTTRYKQKYVTTILYKPVVDAVV
ncbi:hypothetical protein HK100_002294, partial [Physocladia obscura]